MPIEDISYRSFCWSLGTTSFRTKNFNLTIERQLQLLNEFWQKPENEKLSWSNNNQLQERYYLFMLENKFVKGEAPRKDKDAREKTSGLVDLGLIDNERRLTEAGTALLEISLNSDFDSDNDLQLAKDSYIYFKQLLKTSNNVDGNIVRPFIVLSYLLSELDYLTKDEFTYLLPLCTTKENTIYIKDKILSIRKNGGNIDEIIIDTLMQMDNYKQALAVLLNNPVDEDLICCIGINRKSRQYDKPYYPLYVELKKLFLDNDCNNAINVFKAIDNIKIKTLWKNIIFNTISKVAIKRDPTHCLKKSLFSDTSNEIEFKIAFFKTLHLLKAKATLKDYFDLNRRYFKITDTVIFEDGKVHFDIVPKYFINAVISKLFEYGFVPSEKLYSNCKLEEIAPCLVVKEHDIIKGINNELGGNIRTMEEAKQAVLDERLSRFNELIDSKFNDDTLIGLLDKFEIRNDQEIQELVTDNADIPTIFEYILGVIWYKVSDRKGNILSFMNLSLEADLLPKTHAGGGEADIVYQYSACSEYPEHCLLLEATLADGTNQRRMEMEPVSRHLGEHILKTGNTNSYCVFSTTYLDRNVISDFRNRKTYQYYNRDYTKSVNGLKIIPLQTAELKEIIRNKLNYKKLYSVLNEAYQSNDPIPAWYLNNIISKIKRLEHSS